MENCDFLFITWNCPDCAKIKMWIDNKFTFEDDAMGRKGQHLVVIQTYSNVGAKAAVELAGGFDIFVPVLKKSNGEFISSVDEILSYMKEQGFLKEEYTKID